MTTLTTPRLSLLLGSEANPAGGPDDPFERVSWIRDAGAAGVRIVGIGTGAQALAVALGGSVTPARRAQRGWISVHTLAPEWIAPGPWLAWSQTSITLPAGAELLAVNDLGPQAFRIGDHLGINFHPQATPSLVWSWVARSEDPLDVQGILEATIRDQAEAAVASRRLLAGIAGLQDWES